MFGTAAIMSDYKTTKERTSISAVVNLTSSTLDHNKRNDHKQNRPGSHEQSCHLFTLTAVLLWAIKT
uniref:Uncharacterized protein n=1 Tax=Arundo donax TaxID=35708 RepID=A0A0A9FMF3_ARUDO